MIYFNQEIKRSYTDGSAEEASELKGLEYISNIADGIEEQISFSTGSLSMNYKAESEALSHTINTITLSFYQMLSQSYRP